jgi:hypothetical protein
MRIRNTGYRYMYVGIGGIGIITGISTGKIIGIGLGVCTYMYIYVHVYIL